MPKATVGRRYRRALLRGTEFEDELKGSPETTPPIRVRKNDEPPILIKQQKIKTTEDSIHSVERKLTFEASESDGVKNVVKDKGGKFRRVGKPQPTTTAGESSSDSEKVGKKPSQPACSQTGSQANRKKKQHRVSFSQELVPSQADPSNDKIPADKSPQKAFNSVKDGPNESSTAKNKKKSVTMTRENNSSDTITTTSSGTQDKLSQNSKSKSVKSVTVSKNKRLSNFLATVDSSDEDEEKTSRNHNKINQQKKIKNRITYRSSQLQEDDNESEPCQRASQSKIVLPKVSKKHPHSQGNPILDLAHEEMSQREHRQTVSQLLNKQDTAEPPSLFNNVVKKNKPAKKPQAKKAAKKTKAKNKRDLEPTDCRKRQKVAAFRGSDSEDDSPGHDISHEESDIECDSYKVFMKSRKEVKAKKWKRLERRYKQQYQQSKGSLATQQTPKIVSNAKSPLELSPKLLLQSTTSKCSQCQCIINKSDFKAHQLLCEQSNHPEQDGYTSGVTVSRVCSPGRSENEFKHASQLKPESSLDETSSASSDIDSESSNQDTIFNHIGEVYEKYCPEKIALLPTLMNDYKKVAAQALRYVVEKYGSASSTEHLLKPIDHKSRLESYFLDKQLDHSQTTLSEMLKQYNRSEEALFLTLEMQYGVQETPVSEFELRTKETDDTDLRSEIHSILSKYEPTSVPFTDRLVTDAGQHGHQLVAALLEKFSPQQPSEVANSHRIHRLEETFKKYDASRVADVPTLVQSHVEDFENFHYKLLKKYDPVVKPGAQYATDTDY